MYFPPTLHSKLTERLLRREVERLQAENERLRADARLAEAVKIAASEKC